VTARLATTSSSGSCDAELAWQNLARKTRASAARRPSEPVSSLDTLARLEFMREVMTVAVGTGLTGLIASHVVSELERLCGWLIVVARGQFLR
jgi:ABC-type thiamine transport system ATPase subunit